MAFRSKLKLEPKVEFKSFRTAFESPEVKSALLRFTLQGIPKRVKFKLIGMGARGIEETAFG